MKDKDKQGWEREEEIVRNMMARGQRHVERSECTDVL